LESLKVYPDSFGSSYEDQKLKERLGFEEYIEQNVFDKFIVGAFDAARLIGICGFFRKVDAERMNAGEIIQMYVQAKYQSNKIGYLLLQAAIEEAFKIAGIENIELGVFTANKSANTLFDNVGFEEYLFHENHLNDRGVKIGRRLMVLSRDNHMAYR